MLASLVGRRDVNDVVKTFSYGEGQPDGDGRPFVVIVTRRERDKGGKRRVNVGKMPGKDVKDLGEDGTTDRYSRVRFMTCSKIVW